MSTQARLLIVFVIIAVLEGGYLLSRGSTIGVWNALPEPTEVAGPDTQGAEATVSVITESNLDPQFMLTKEESLGNIAEKKAYILKRVRFGTPLSATEKTEIGSIMFLKSEVYKFSDAERADIFKVLNSK